MDLENAIKSLLPYFIVAGDYALQVQEKVEGTTIAAEGTIFSQSVTDADLSIQGLFEMILLAQMPEVSFYGEESPKLLNTKYFPNEAEYLVTLDPLNHTLSFKDGHSTFDIILTICQGKKIKAAVAYLPAFGEFYIGIEGLGGFVTTRAEVEKQAGWRPRSLGHTMGKVLVYNNAPLKDRISKQYECVDLVGDYDPRQWDVMISGILRGDLIAFIRPNADLIDWGAVAFIAEQCGAIVTDVAGSPIPPYLDYPDKRIPSLVVSVNQELQLALLQLIGSGGGL